MFVEGDFSLIGNIWTDKINGLHLSLGKAEICPEVNFNMSCASFFKFIKDKNQIENLKCAMDVCTYYVISREFQFLYK